MALSFDSGKLAPNFSISNAGRTITTAGGGNDGSYSLCDNYQSSGKYYVEFVEVGSSTGWGAIAICKNTVAGTGSGVWAGGDTGTAGPDPGDNQIYVEGSGGGAWRSANTLGNRFGVCFDLDNKKIWARNITAGEGWLNQVIGSQNPATNTGGVSFNTGSVATGPWTICAGQDNDAGSGITLYSAPADWTGSPPSGFGEWNASAAATKAILLPRRPLRFFKRRF